MVPLGYTLNDGNWEFFLLETRVFYITSALAKKNVDISNAELKVLINIIF
jgi:hypothetical protein